MSNTTGCSCSRHQHVVGECCGSCMGAGYKDYEQEKRMSGDMSDNKRLGEMYSQDIQEAVDKMLRVFGGEDGGSGYARLMGLLQKLDKASEGGDPNAHGVLQCVRQFSRLIDVAEGKRG